MKNKDVENRIYSSLESGETLSHGVLDSAKSEMKSRKAPARKPVLKYALASIAIAVVALVVALPVLLTTKPQNNNDTRYNYMSMQQYVIDNDIDFNPYMSKLNSGGEWFSQDIYIRSNFYEQIDNGATVYVCENYKYNNGDIVELYVCLLNDTTMEQKYFYLWEECDNIIIIDDCCIQYQRINQNFWMAKFVINDLHIYLYINSQNYDDFRGHVERLILKNQ